MIYLADANVICEPTKLYPSAQVCDWLKANSEDVVIDSVVMGEIWEGIVSLPQGRKRRDLAVWFAQLRKTVRCLAWTDETAVVWGQMRRDIRMNGFTVAVKDSMIAASARTHGIKVVTRNADDFLRCGVEIVNPFS
jgi:toxin FitB